jgi:hypothetical protein
VLTPALSTPRPFHRRPRPNDGRAGEISLHWPQSGSSATTRALQSSLPTTAPSHPKVVAKERATKSPGRDPSAVFSLRLESVFTGLEVSEPVFNLEKSESEDFSVM